MLQISFLVSCWCALAASAGAGDEKHNPGGKTDREQLQGVWELRVKGGGTNYVLRLSFEDGGAGGFDILCPKGDKEGVFSPAIFNGVSYKLVERGGNRVIAIADCLMFPTRAAYLPYEFKDGALVLKGAKVKLTLDELKLSGQAKRTIDELKLSELDLSGTWKRK